MSNGSVVLIIESPNSTFKRKNRHKIGKRKTNFIATKFIAKSPNIIPLPFKVTAPRSIKFTTGKMTKMNYSKV